MVKEVKPEELLQLRHEVIRPNLPLEKAAFPTDSLTDTIHLGYFHNDELVAGGSFHRETYQNDQGLGFRLRGLACKFEHRREGYCSAIMDLALVMLKEREVEYIWGNARRSSYKFFEKYTLKYLSKEFEIEGIGLHRVMMYKFPKED